MAVDPSHAVELAEIEKIEASAAARRDALAQAWGEGTIVMVRPGAPEILYVKKGKLVAAKVNYLTGGPTS